MALEYTTAKPEEREVAAALCNLCLPGASKGYFLARMTEDPQLLPGGLLVARDGPRIVSNVTVLGVEFIYGNSSVRCGGIANVATHPDYRGRGAASALLVEAHRLMRRHGLAISLLGTGIPAFYAPHGYVPWERSDTNLLKPRRSAPGRGVRPLDPRTDPPALKPVRDRYLHRFIGGFERSEEVWRKQYSWTPDYPSEDLSLGMVAERSGKPRAYLRATFEPDTDVAGIAEFAALDGSEAEIGELAKSFTGEVARRGLKAINMPAVCSELAKAIAPLAEAAATARNSSYMLAMLDLPEFLQSISPDLAKRSPGRGAVTISHEQQSALITTGEGTVKVDSVASRPAGPRAELDPGQWMEVFMGVRTFSAQPFARHSRLGEAGINVLDALFPKRDSVMWSADAL